MSKTIDYFYSHLSPWAFLGHPRLHIMAQAQGAAIAYWPVSVAEIFPKTGGVPLAKRAPERRAYRMVELKRWSAYLGIDMNFEPKFFPTDDKPSMLLALAAKEQGADLNPLSGAMMNAVWQQERDIGDWSTLADIAEEQGLDGKTLVATAQSEPIANLAAEVGEKALQAGCFGVPWYSLDGEGFWGQDRLMLLEHRLKNG